MYNDPEKRMTLTFSSPEFFLFAEPQSYYGTHEYVPETFVISHGSLEIPSPTGVQVGTGPGATVSIPSVSIRPPTEEAMECP